MEARANIPVRREGGPFGAPALILIAWLAVVLAACDSSTAPEAGEAVVTGSVEAWGGHAAAAAQGGESSPSAQAAAEARAVAIGRLGSSGQIDTFAEGEVAADGAFRIEGVPAGHGELVVVAYAEGGEEVGRVVLHERTRADATHRTHPMDARATFHARTWTAMRSAGDDRTSSAELALYLHADASTAAMASMTSGSIEAAAAAATAARAAFDAVLEAEGDAQASAAARAQALAELAAERDRARDQGQAAGATQDAFVSAAFEAFVEAGSRMDALALASAAAATAFDASLAAHGETTARLELARQALLLNLEARTRAAARVEGNPLGLRAAIAAGLAETQTRVRSAGSTTELRIALDEARAQVEAGILSTAVGSLVVLGGGTEGEAEAAFETALERAALWAELEAAGSAEARIEAATALRARIDAAVQAFLATVPSEVRADAGLSAEVLTALLIAFGAGPDCA